MGGSGSGRHSKLRRARVEQMLQLDLLQLQRNGLLRSALMQIGWPSGASITILHKPAQLTLLYRRLDGCEEKKDVVEIVKLVSTKQRLGGQRSWLLCPGCGKRCRILYAGVLFRCRRCHQLRYGSQSDTKIDRASRGMFKIVRRINPTQRCNALPERPKGMRKTTYGRLAARYARYERQWHIEIFRRFTGKNVNGTSG